MKKTLLASVAMLSLALAVPAMAQDNTDAGAAVGMTGGAAGGATIGFLAGGPIGAIVGGFAGAVLGAEAGIAATTVEYAGNNPVEPIIIEGDIAAGATVPDGVTVYPVEGDPAYGYIYANGRVWIVDLASNTLVYSPGFTVNQSAADFAIANPVEPVVVEGDVVVGYVLPSGTVVTPVPEDPYYGYVYIDGRPALVESATGTIVWVQ